MNMMIIGGVSATNSTDFVSSRTAHIEHARSPSAKDEGALSLEPAISFHSPIPLSGPSSTAGLNNKSFTILPFGLLMVTVQGHGVPNFSHKAVLLQYCQKASHIILQIAAEIGGGFCYGLPSEHEYQIFVLLSEGSESVVRKQHMVLSDSDLQIFLQPFAKDKAVFEAWNVPLILVDFSHSDHLDVAAKRSADLKTRKFQLMVNTFKANSKALHIDHTLISVLSNTVHNVKHNEECMSSGCAEKRLEDGDQGIHTIDNQAERPRKRRRFSNLTANNDETHTSTYRKTEQAGQNNVVTSLLEDNAKLSMQVSRLADELEQTTLARDFLRSLQETAASTERFRSYESEWYTDQFEKLGIAINAVHREKRLIEAKSVYLLKKSQRQSHILKQAESFIDHLQEKMELLEAKKNLRIGDLEGELRKALVYVDGLHKYYGISISASTRLAQQFCDSLREAERHAATQMRAAEKERTNLKRKRSESEP